MLRFKELEPQDLESAIEHGASEDILMNSPYTIEFLDPLELLEGLGLTMESSSEKDIYKLVDFIIKEGNDPFYDWTGLFLNPIPPVVVVDDTLVDGIHRCVAAVASRCSVKAIVFKKDQKIT